MAMQDHEIAAYNGQRVTITFNEYDEHPQTGRMEVSGRFSGTGRLIFRPPVRPDENGTVVFFPDDGGLSTTMYAHDIVSVVSVTEPDMQLWLALPSQDSKSSEVEGLVIRAVTEQHALDQAGEYVGDVAWTAKPLTAGGPPGILFGAERACWELLAAWDGERPATADTAERGEDKSAATTKHTCNDGDGPHFGRLAPPGQCRRCDELRAGAEPVRWRNSRRRDDAQRRAELDEHFRSRRHNDPSDPNWCGRVCTFGEW